MEKNYKENDFLAKWASGSLSQKEKEEFEKTKDFVYFKAILDGTEKLEVPSYDKENLFNKVKNKKEESNKVVYLIPKWVYAVAASVTLLLGVVFFLNQSNDYTTDYGEQLALELPDGSKVILNAKSRLQYSKKGWGKERKVTLNGEAFFKVKKGSTFIVNTDQGSVTVLGTHFTTNSRDAIFEVVCFEGKVRVAKGQLSKIINGGEGIRAIEDSFEKWELNKVEPTWIQEESSFSNAPLIQVISDLEYQYNLSINSSAIDVNLRFTGSYTHTNVANALKTVFVPLEIKYTFDDKENLVLSRK